MAKTSKAFVKKASVRQPDEKPAEPTLEEKRAEATLSRAVRGF